MAKVTFTTQEEFDSQYKKRMFDNIDHLCSSGSTLIETIKNTQEHINIKMAGDLLNIGITFNNKLIEFSQLFNTAGISMFSQIYTSYGSNTTPFISSSFVGDSILFYLIGKVEESFYILKNYEAKLYSLINLEREKCNAFYSANPIKKFSLN